MNTPLKVDAATPLRPGATEIMTTGACHEPTRAYIKKPYVRCKSTYLSCANSEQRCSHRIQRGFCRQKHDHRNTDSKIGPGG